MNLKKFSLLLLSLNLLASCVKKTVLQNNKFEIKKIGNIYLVNKFPCNKTEANELNQLPEIAIAFFLEKSETENVKCINSLIIAKDIITEFRPSVNPHRKHKIKGKLIVTKKITQAMLKFKNVSRIRSQVSFEPIGIRQLASAQKLTSFDLSQAPALTKKQINEIGKMQYLQVLKINVKKNTIDVNSFSGLLRLYQLQIWGSSINTKAFKQITALRKLIIKDNNSSFTNLALLTKLTILNISNSKVTSIDFAKKLVELTNLNIDNTQIRDVNPLQNLKRLKVVSLKNTAVKDLSAIRHVAKVIK